MNVGILLTGHTPESLAPEFGQYDRMFHTLLADQGFSFRTYAVVEGVFPESVEEAEAWIITGSRHGVYESHPWIAPLEAFIRQAYAASVPMVGVCFGHQIMAQALGGRVAKFDGGWRVGVQTYQFDGLQQPQRLLAWHQDQVLQPPAEAVTIATGAQCQHAALLYPGKAFSVQPHPEFNLPFVKGLLQARGDNLPSELRQSTDAQLQATEQLDGLAKPIGHFLKHRQLWPSTVTP